MLTTEQLRARAESLGLDFFIERRAGIWVKEWFENGCTSATAEEVMMWSMLANREAQPVYQYRMRNPYNGQVTDWETTKPEQVDFILKETIAANVEFRIIAAPPAQAVPEEMKRDPDADVFDPGFMNGWNACRAAMLKGEKS